MRAGLLRERVVIEKPADPPVQDEWGDVVETWVEHATRWGAVEPLRGAEFFQAQQTQAAVDYRIRLRYDALTAAITPAMRIRWGVRLFDLQPPTNPDLRQQEIQVMAKERS